MTNMEKQDLRAYCKRGLTFKQIRGLVGCADATIKQYLKVFAPAQTKQTKEEE